ncbi:MAG: hypothetical protein ABIR32_17190 [Ilumatobacteraceae bacterium]
MDITFDAVGGHGFVTAVTAWIAYRRRELDEIAHRSGDEMLRWHSWGRIGTPCSAVSDEDASWMDELARC